MSLDEDNDWVSVSSSSDMALQVYKRDMIKERTAREVLEAENCELRSDLSRTSKQLEATREKLEVAEEERDSIKQMKRALAREKKELEEYADALKAKVEELQRWKSQAERYFQYHKMPFRLASTDSPSPGK